MGCFACISGGPTEREESWQSRLQANRGDLLVSLSGGRNGALRPKGRNKAETERESATGRRAAGVQRDGEEMGNGGMEDDENDFYSDNRLMLMSKNKKKSVLYC